MGHSTDLPILAEILKTKSLPYLGVIGSKAKRNVIEKELAELGIDSKAFICPIGEDIGSNSPSEIAISITAQLLKYRDSK
jgi:xanthine dehydrogenase accessory factor